MNPAHVFLISLAVLAVFWLEEAAAIAEAWRQEHHGDFYFRLGA